MIIAKLSFSFYIAPTVSPTVSAGSGKPYLVIKIKCLLFLLKVLV